jgi:WD40 repeat protein
MASVSTKAAATKSILTPSMTLKGHGGLIQSISYFPDGQRMISGSQDKTARQWDLKAGKEIEETWGVCEEKVYAVAVSRDGRWVVTGGGDNNRGELKVYEVETGIVKTFEGHSLQRITCIDISSDSKLLASSDKKPRIWNLDTGKLVVGPLESAGWVGAVRFSTDSKKLAAKSFMGDFFEVWDVQLQKLDARVGEYGGLGLGYGTFSQISWTNNNKSVIAAFSFTVPEDAIAITIYEFDASTLEPVGAPFEEHTQTVTSLALSFDDIILASASYDNTIKLWVFESRQLLASFDVQNVLRLTFSPNSRQLAYVVNTKDDYGICICNTPPNVLAQARVRIPFKTSTVRVLTLLHRLLHAKSRPLMIY